MKTANGKGKDRDETEGAVARTSFGGMRAIFPLAVLGGKT